MGKVNLNGSILSRVLADTLLAEYWGDEAGILNGSRKPEDHTTADGFRTIASRIVSRVNRLRYRGFKYTDKTADGDTRSRYTQDGIGVSRPADIRRLRDFLPSVRRGSDNWNTTENRRGFGGLADLEAEILSAAHVEVLTYFRRYFAQRLLTATADTYESRVQQAVSLCINSGIADLCKKHGQRYRKRKNKDGVLEIPACPDTLDLHYDTDGQSVHIGHQKSEAGFVSRSRQAVSAMLTGFPTIGKVNHRLTGLLSAIVNGLDVEPSADMQDIAIGLGYANERLDNRQWVRSPACKRFSRDLDRLRKLSAEFSDGLDVASESRQKPLTASVRLPIGQPSVLTPYRIGSRQIRTAGSLPFSAEHNTVKLVVDFDGLEFPPVETWATRTEAVSLPSRKPYGFGVWSEYFDAQKSEADWSAVSRQSAEHLKAKADKLEADLAKPVNPNPSADQADEAEAVRRYKPVKPTAKPVKVSRQPIKLVSRVSFKRLEADTATAWQIPYGSMVSRQPSACGGRINTSRQLTLIGNGQPLHYVSFQPYKPEAVS